MEVINSLDTLFPPFREQVEKFVVQAKELDFFIYETYRSFDRQFELYKQGRELQNGVWVVVDSKLVRTNAKPGSSFHAYGLAFDSVTDADETKQGIQWSWNDTYKDKNGVIQKVDWKGMGKISVALGMEWAGNWKTFVEYPHSQNTFGFKISELYPVLTAEGLESVWKMIYKKIKPDEIMIPVTVIMPKPTPIPVATMEGLDRVSNTVEKASQDSSIGNLIIQIIKIFLSIFSKRTK